MNQWTLRRLQEKHEVVPRLRDQQFGWRAAETKAELLARAAAALEAGGVSASEPAMACFVPGRVEVLGKHTDYAGGRSIVAAVERGICLVAVPNQDEDITIVDAATQESTHFPLDEDLHPREGQWVNYTMTVARRVARNFPGVSRGARIAFVSDLPPAAGMSSSSALMVSIFLALSAANEIPERAEYAENIHSPEDLAGYLGTVENGQTFGTLAGDAGVGTFGGSEDHTAILCARPGKLRQYSYCPVRFERSIGLPEDVCFALGVSGVVAEKTGKAMAKYNRTSLLAAAVLDSWRRDTGRADPHLAAALHSSADAADQIRRILRRTYHPHFSAPEMLDRFEQFLAESEQIIPEVPETWDEAAWGRFGQLVDRSQSLGARLLKNQVPETIFLAQCARQQGAAAASAFGAGFGGSVWAIVKTSDAPDFCRDWADAYARAYPQHQPRARFEISGAGPAAFTLSDGD